MKIAHLSDIHFYKNELSLSLFFSKKILGSLNHLLNPNRRNSKCDPYSIIHLLKEHEVTHVLITGDFTTTSNHSEFKLAHQYCERLKNEGFEVLAIPGNHDHYTLKADRERRFYQYLPHPKNLKQDRCSLVALNEDLYALFLDTTLATPLWSSQGLFHPKTEEKARKLMEKCPREAKVILINHFPVLPNERPTRHQMKRKSALKAFIEDYPNIFLYLYGHTHRSEFSKSLGPLTVNCGSLTLSSGTFHIIDLGVDFIEFYAYQQISGQWLIKSKTVFPKKSLIS